jgi:hypothetical protein
VNHTEVVNKISNQQKAAPDRSTALALNTFSQVVKLSVPLQVFSKFRQRHFPLFYDFIMLILSNNMTTEFAKNNA